MNIIKFHTGDVVITLPFDKVLINGYYYKEPVAVCRLLTPSEFFRITQIDTNFPSAKTELEDNVIELCFKSFIGVDEQVDWDVMDGGHVSTLVNAIIYRSGFYISNPVDVVNGLLPLINFTEQVQAIVSRFLMIPFKETKELPVHELYHYYAICIKAFPQEVNMPEIVSPDKQEEE